VLDGYLHLLGGLTWKNPTSLREPTTKIITASISNPLSWNYYGNNILLPIFGSHAAILNTNVYMFGGQLEDKTYTNNIITASIYDLSSWTIVGALPRPSANGQFVVIGNDGYLFTTTDAGGTPKFTSIFKCHTAAPHIWYDTGSEIPGEVSYSQLAIIYDRLFLFGGSGSSIVFASTPDYKYLFNSPAAIEYAHRSRTIVESTLDKNDLFKALGFPYWKTDYIK
jgi:hypothetical protein